jgi:hypothetical protein
MTTRRRRRALARSETQAREWAHNAARSLVLALCDGQGLPATPFRVGVVLGPGEDPWVECPARFLQETPLPGPEVDRQWPPIRRWLVTSERIVGRLGDGRLYGYRWDQMVGCRVDLTGGCERVGVDLFDGTPLTWSGPAVAPMAVAAVAILHGPGALVHHPGLSILRCTDYTSVSAGSPRGVPRRG